MYLDMYRGLQHMEWYFLGPDMFNGALHIAASVYDGQEELPVGVLEAIMAVTTLTNDPPGLTTAVALENCTFNFVANNILTGEEVHLT